jgi:hypothetical protein
MVVLDQEALVVAEMVEQVLEIQILVEVEEPLTDLELHQVLGDQVL